MVRTRSSCTVEDCQAFAVGRGLCRKHYMRQRRQGHTESTRPRDWGKRDKHPLIETWRWQKTRGSTKLCKRWLDFWKFVEDVGEKPSPNHTLRCLDSSKEMGPDNCEWVEKLIVNPEDYRQNKREYQRLYRERHPERTRSGDLKRYFGIDLDEYNALLHKQDGKCAICREQETAMHKGEPRNLAVDHCHETGQIRGLLCSKCNIGLGSFKDRPDLLQAALAYLT